MKKNITLKQLFERVVTLEAKMDAKTENDKIVAKTFKNFVLLIIGIELFNFIFTYLAFLE